MIKLKEYSQNTYQPLGNSVMGTVGDGSFIGPEGERKGTAKKPVYKTPKSSIHYKKGRFAIDPDFHNDDNWEVDQKSSYIADKSVPKNSIHSDQEPDENRTNAQTMEQLGMPVAADGTINGGPRMEKDKKSKGQLYTKGYFYELAEKKRKEKSKPEPLLNQNFSFVTEKQLRDLTDKVLRENNPTLTDEEYKLQKPELVKKYIREIMAQQNEIKNYDQQVIPKSSIHYGQIDKVPGEPKMKFEKIVKAGFVPDEIKNLTTQGDWKNNLTKAVMDLTDDAQVKEPITPVPQKPIGDTPEFPYANEQDGTMVYPIPDGGGSAIKGKGGWTFGNTPEIPSLQPAQGGGCEFGQPVDGEIDIPFTKKPLIKKLIMFMKKEQQNLHEGIKLKGIYEGKLVKLNVIYEGEHRRFKTFVKTNEGKVVKIHFGPGLNEECGHSKEQLDEDFKGLAAGLGLSLFTLFSPQANAQGTNPANDTTSVTQSIKGGNNVSAKETKIVKNDNGTFTINIIFTDGTKDINKSFPNVKLNDMQRTIDKATFDARADFGIQKTKESKEMNELSPSTYDKVIGAYKGGNIGGERGRNTVAQASQLKRKQIAKQIIGKRISIKDRDVEYGGKITDVKPIALSSGVSSEVAIFFDQKDASGGSSEGRMNISKGNASDTGKLGISLFRKSNGSSSQSYDCSVDVATAKLLAGYFREDEDKLAPDFRELASNYRNYSMF